MFNLSLVIAIFAIAASDTIAPLAPTVRVIGHRGASALRPEHTLAAYAKAIDDGADFIEPDLVITRDGVLVARHENEIGGTTDVAGHPEFASRKVTKTVDGQSVSGWFSEDFTLAELKTLRARERLPELRGIANDGAFEIPTLEEIIELAAARSTTLGHPIGLVPEIKHSTYFRALRLPIEDKLLATLQGHAFTRKAPIEIQSFEIGNLRYLHNQIKHKHANIRLLQLLGAPYESPFDQRAMKPSLTYAQMMTPQGLRAIAEYADAIGPNIRSIRPLTSSGRIGAATPLVADAHAAHLEVHAYTFRPENHFLPKALQNDAGEAARNESGSIAEIRAYLEAGIDAFFTDDPQVGRKALAVPGK